MKLEKQTSSVVLLLQEQSLRKAGTQKEKSKEKNKGLVLDILLGGRRCLPGLPSPVNPRMVVNEQAIGGKMTKQICISIVIFISGVIMTKFSGALVGGLLMYFAVGYVCFHWGFTNVMKHSIKKDKEEKK